MNSGTLRHSRTHRTKALLAARHAALEPLFTTAGRRLRGPEAEAVLRSIQGLRNPADVVVLRTGEVVPVNRVVYSYNCGP